MAKQPPKDAQKSIASAVALRRAEFRRALLKILREYDPKSTIKDLDESSQFFLSSGIPYKPEEDTVNSIVARASEVIGDRQEAMRWMGTPVRALDFATPISVLGTREGAQRVTDVLGQMERGVW